MLLDGRMAVVTGAGRGIGRAVALGLADLGAVSVLVARSANELEQTIELVRERGGRAVAAPADLGSPDAVAEVVSRAEAALGPIDVLVNNAATVQPLAPSTQVDAAAWEAAFQLNVTVPATLAFALLKGMLSRGWGRVVNVSSGIAANPGSMIGANAYAATKAALEAHTLNLAAELDGSGVTANVYRPGSVDTAMQAWIRDNGKGRIGDTTHQNFLRRHEQGALISPEDSAAVLLRRLTGPDNGRIWDVRDRP
ncbi:SDR family NAD(P)-dependent oxidoreductase [Streptomyces sp. NBC_01190]|uniref:SDR family NAD(P)-dependent oxidoreductase n=1 Tax=Streptomyces sp. NBC_01190 TaxID=2903767 RepID=UPI0038633C2F|nr:SDR family oxidoreductase [Streptomyces sp. NBC_01190]